MNARDDTEKLLERFSAEWPSDNSIVERVMQEIESTPVRNNLAFKLQRLTTKQRIAVGSIGLSAVAALVLAVFAIASAERATAMERMIEKLRDVTSFQYTLNVKNTFTREGAKRPVTVEDTGMVWWLAPSSFREDMRIIEYDANSPPGKRESKLLSDFVAIHPAGRRGIIVDHLKKTVLWLPAWQGEFPDYSPVAKLRMVKEKSGEIVRELGSKNMIGKTVNGFVMRLHGAVDGSGFDALEVWLDPETDLPVEFGYSIPTEWGAQSYRLFDCRWNIDVDPLLFEARAPEGYTDTTPPKSDEAIGQIIEALSLYAELSGGHYPRVTHFDANAIKDEMLRMAGFVGEPQEEWTDNPKFQQVQQAAPGLDWISRIVLNPSNAGYHGKTVDAKDKDKVLLWWTVVPERSYRVFFGDLNTELLTGDWWQQLRDGKVVRGATKEMPATDVK